MSIIAPTTKKELFARISEIIQHKEYIMPDKRYIGTGAPGLYLEDLLGLRTGNKDIPDTLGWELKFYTEKTNLITLFHKEPRPDNVIRLMVSKWGWKDDMGRLSFRHTIAGKSDRFKVEADSHQIIIRRLDGNGAVPYWTDDDIMSSAGAKLRRLILVKGVRTGQKIVYNRADSYENLELSSFIDEVVRGTVKIDFDVREAKPESKGLRNHGTKFRVSPYDIGRLYSKKDRIG
jgi:hypothetical protein